MSLNTTNADQFGYDPCDDVLAGVPASVSINPASARVFQELMLPSERRLFENALSQWIVGIKNALGAPGHDPEHATDSLSNIDTRLNVILGKYPDLTPGALSRLLKGIEPFTIDPVGGASDGGMHRITSLSRGIVNIGPGRAHVTSIENRYTSSAA